MYVHVHACIHIDAYGKQWAAREKVALTTLNEWACAVKRLVENRIIMLKGHRQNTQKKQTLKDPAGKQTLDKLHEDYVLAPTDKTGIINTIRKYLRKSDNSGASTYMYLCCNETVDQIIDCYVDFMRRNNIKDFDKLPSFYCMPKLHKNPYGHRFIAASSACATKPLSRLLMQCLKLILKQ